MKLSVSLRGEDIDFLDAYARTHGIRSRSAAVARAVNALREFQLRSEYERAFAEWEDAGDAEDWEGTAPDGL